MIVMGVFTMMCMPVIGILIDKWGRVPTILLSTFLGGMGLILMGFAKEEAKSEKSAGSSNAGTSTDKSSGAGPSGKSQQARKT